MPEPSHIQIESARHRLAIEAAYEVEFLSETIRKAVKGAGDNLDIAFRGLAVRLNELSNIIAEALDDISGTTSTNDLSERLRGEGIDEEVIHV